MILEVATITVRAGREAAFERGAAQAAPLFERAAGCRSFRIDRSIEHPDRYLLIVGWDAVEDHARFRDTADFARWRELVADTFAGAPDVHHVRTVVPGFLP